MNGKFLLDTNIIIELFNGNEKIINRLLKIPEVFISTITIGELYYGAYKSSKRENNITKIEEYIIESSILDCNLETSKNYGLIKNELKKKGNPIPENDIWIASITRQNNLTLITMDRHFENIESISLELLQ